MATRLPRVACCSISPFSTQVLLGAAVLAAAAGGAHGSVRAAMAAMTSVGSMMRPSADPSVLSFYRRKYRVFVRMTADQRAYREMMQQEGETE